MTWLNPLAFVGLLAVVIPVLVHLFGRRRARSQRFPSLRLLTEARPTPATRSRPSDVLLLVVRCAVVVAAVAALAQPRWKTTGQSRETPVPVRAILLDTSASMRRLTSAGRPAIDDAREIASRLLDSSRAGLIVESNRPGADAAGAASWLAARGGARELVVVSDFQAGAVEDGHLAAVPSEIGIRLARVAARGAPSGERVAPPGLTMGALPTRTEATWPVSSGSAELPLHIFAADDEREAVDAALSAARATIGEAPTGTQRASIVFPGSPDRAGLIAGAIPLDSAWYGDVLLALRNDPVLAAIAASTFEYLPCDGPGAPIALGSRGLAIARIAGRAAAGDLLIIPCVDPGTLLAATLMARTAAALTSASSITEREPGGVPDEQLRRWERPGVDAPPTGTDGESSDGRWFWLAALVLLLVEEWLRRRPANHALVAPEARHARVA